MLRFFGLSLFALVSAYAAGKTANTVTFYKDALPIIQKNCQGCHRPGEAAPMAFMTYEGTRPWAKAMKQAVLQKKMPPWFADPHVGKFTNDRSMSEADIQKLVAWVDAGAPAGSAKDAPAPIAYTEGWTIGKPDKVIEFPEAIPVAASGTIDYTYMIVPTGLTEDKWIQMAEARPGMRAQVHHIIAFVRQPDSKWMRDYPVGQPFVPKKGGNMGIKQVQFFLSLRSGGGILFVGMRQVYDYCC
jgi:hypothetical protein